jgi:hypothetical protein
MIRPSLFVRGIISSALIIGLAGCGFYSFKSGRTALVSSIGIPLFENRTAEYGLAEQLTEGITNGLIEENIVKVADPSRAESILKGTVLTYKRSAYTYDADENVSEYLVEITIQARLVSTADETPIWDAASIRGWGEYAADAETEQDGQKRAIEKLTEEIINRTVKGW